MSGARQHVKITLVAAGRRFICLLMSKITQISLAAPAYNEAANISLVVESWISHLKEQAGLAPFEIVVCNDGSLDRTGKFSTPWRHVIRVPVHLEINQGGAAALARAIACTALDWVLLLDFDGQYAIEDLDRMVRAVDAHDALAATGVRAVKRDSLFAASARGRAAGFAISFTARGTAISIARSSSFRDASPALARTRGERGDHSTEITSKLLERGVEQVEVEIEHRPRSRGSSSMKLLKGALDRFLFVLYIGIRQLLLRLKVLQRAAP